jgi:hypothetical protein
MSKNETPNKPTEIRIVDRRPFDAAGERRTDDVVEEDSSEQAPTAPAAAPERGPAAAANPGTRPDPVASGHFQNLVLNLARQAAAGLGAAQNPLTGEVGVDLQGAQHLIDLLDALRVKTRGNLSAEESEMLEGLIGDLQMQFVAVRSKTSKSS